MPMECSVKNTRNCLFCGKIGYRIKEALREKS